MFSENGQYDKDKIIRLSLQWIHSKVKLIDYQIQQCDAQIKTAENSLSRFMLDLSNLYAPFK